MAFEKRSLEMWIDRAVHLAQEGMLRGDGGPFGALVVDGREVIGQAWNQVLVRKDPTAHAEVLAIREAAARQASPHLHGCLLFTSCEPCPMCLAAAYWAHLDGVWYAAGHEDAEAAGFDDAFIYQDLCRPPADRRLALQRLLRDEAVTLFETWKRRGGILY